MIVNNNGSASATFVSVPATYGSAFFTWPGGQAVATRQDYSYAVKSGTFTTATIAAKPGDVVILWGTGFGPTTPGTLEGLVVPNDRTYSTTTAPTVTVNGVAATVYGAALTPGFAGLYQVAIQVPSSVGSGDWPIVATIGGVASPSGVVLSVQK